MVVDKQLPSLTNPKHIILFLLANPSYNGIYHELNFRINLLENEFGFSSFGFKNNGETTGTWVKQNQLPLKQS
jgi:hypothetical protein